MQFQQRGLWLGLFLAGLLAGCASTDFAGLLWMNDNGKGDRVLVGSLDAVATSTQTSLTRLGFQVAASPEGETVHLTASKSGKQHFKLILTRELVGQTERTRIRVVWLQPNADQKMAIQVLADVEKSVKR